MPAAMCLGKVKCHIDSGGGQMVGIINSGGNCKDAGPGIAVHKKRTTADMETRELLGTWHDGHM